MPRNADKVKNVEKALRRAKNNVVKAGGQAVKKIKDGDINVEDILRQTMKAPLVRIDRAKYLHKELIKYYPEKTVQKAIKHNPAYAGVERDRINKIARNVINYESNKVTAISFAAGIPGGLAMAATIPADLTQYFAFILRVMQKLAYLYGFEEFNFSEDEISDETLNQIMIFLGVMFGVQGANAGVKIVAEAAAKKVSKTLAQKALTKTAIYPIVKKIAQAVGIRMTKQIFADSVSKIVPVLGGVAAGGLTYATFKPCSLKLQRSFKSLDICDPEFYNTIDTEGWSEEDIDVAETVGPEDLKDVEKLLYEETEETL